MQVKIDIIILSYGKTEQMRAITQQCIDSLVLSEDPDKIGFNILVIESEKSMAPYQYTGSNTIYPDTDFGYNKYMNIGIQATNNKYICLCNNDLVFHKNWATELLKVFDSSSKIVSANPYCDNFDYDIKIKNSGNVIRRDKNPNISGILTGWCIFTRRSLFDKIGLLDEQFTFWYADTDYEFTLKKHRLIHVLVKSSVVTHLVSQSHDLLLDKKDELTIGQKAIFSKKWKHEPLSNKIKRFLRSLFN